MWIRKKLKAEDLAELRKRIELINQYLTDDTKIRFKKGEPMGVEGAEMTALVSIMNWSN